MTGVKVSVSADTCDTQSMCPTEKAACDIWPSEARTLLSLGCDGFMKHEELYAIVVLSVV